MPQDARAFREGRGVGSGVVEPEERPGGFGGEPLGAGGDQQSLAFAVLGQLVEVRCVGQACPQIEAARRHGVDVCLGGVLAQAVHEQVTAGAELFADTAQMCLPGGLGDDVECCGLQQAADVHGLGAAVGQDAFPGRSAGDDRGDAQGGGNALGERPQVYDVAGVVLGGEGPRCGADAEVVGPVVLDQEGPVVANDVQNLFGALG